MATERFFVKIKLPIQIITNSHHLPLLFYHMVCKYNKIMYQTNSQQKNLTNNNIKYYNIAMNQVCFNSIISAYIESNHLNKAIDIFLSFIYIFAQAGQYITLKLLASCVQNKSLNFGKIIHQHINHHHTLKHDLKI